MDKKRCALLYRKEDISKNEWFINKLIYNFSLLSIECVLFYEINSDSVFKKNNHFDFAIYRGRNYSIADELENKGIKVFNSSLVNKIANNKYETFLFAKRNGIPVLDTFIDTNKVTFSPIVCKTVDGHGGNEVFLVDDISCVEKIQKVNPDKKYILQKKCSNPGEDVRVYVVGGKIIACIKRKGASNEFRSNFSLGGTAKIYSPTKRLKTIVSKIIELIKPDFIGIDFIKNSGKWVLNEIEDPVGCRMLYANSKIDIVECFCRYISKSIKKV